MNRRGFLFAAGAAGLLVPTEPLVKRAWWFLGGRNPLVDSALPSPWDRADIVWLEPLGEITITGFEKPTGPTKKLWGDGSPVRIRTVNGLVTLPPGCAIELGFDRQGRIEQRSQVQPVEFA